jgi:Zn-dependent metalloprotease
VALRSMKAPGTAYDDPVLGKDPQPAHMNDIVWTFQDNGGVHINSGIPNHAFYLAATQLGGYAWEKAGRIWYETLRDPQLRPTAGFTRFAQLTLANAQRLYGASSSEQQAVLTAWNQVGIMLT